jgi:ubiquinone/menaquinone biosynthesis C-methylase UbiE
VDRYLEFVGTELTAATETAIDRALLNAFVELVVSGPGARVADVGCGPGRVAAFLARKGFDVVGVDVSHAMLAAARLAHPEIHFEEGRLSALPVANESLAGVVCWYSLIHTPPEYLGDAFTEIKRVLTPGGKMLIAFQAGGGEPIHCDDAHGTGLPRTSYRHQLADVATRLQQVGLDVRATALREPELEHETTPQAFVIAADS